MQSSFIKTPKKTRKFDDERDFSFDKKSKDKRKKQNKQNRDSKRNWDKED